jgi:arylsulfatase A-like enzyme
MMFELDDYVGQIIKALKDTHLDDKTLILVTGDNGPPTHQCQYGGSLGPWTAEWQRVNNGGGGKFSNWEGGHREVSLAVWPGKIPRGAVNPALTSGLDYLPTVANLAGFKLPTNRTFDGIDLSPLLFDNVTDGHQVLFHPNAWGFVNVNGMANGTGEIHAVRVNNYKAHFVTGIGYPLCHQNGSTQVFSHDPPLIFDLAKDPSEANPLTENDPNYKTVLDSVLSAMKKYEASIAADNISVANWAENTSVKPCCNWDSPVCRCDCAATPPPPKVMTVGSTAFWLIFVSVGVGVASAIILAVVLNRRERALEAKYTPVEKKAADLFSDE